MTAWRHLYVVQLETEPPNDQQVEKVVDVLTVKMVDGQDLGNLGVIPLLALQNISKMNKTHQECLYVVRTVQVARMEPANDQEVEKVVEDRAVKMVTLQAQTLPRRNRNLRGHLFVVRSVRVARTEPANDQEVEKVVDNQVVKMVADQAVMNL
jgi:hypothetical protein